MAASPADNFAPAPAAILGRLPSHQIIFDYGGAGLDKVLLRFGECAGEIALDIEFSREVLLHENGNYDFTLHHRRLRRHRHLVSKNRRQYPMKETEPDTYHQFTDEDLERMIYSTSADVWPPPGCCEHGEFPNVCEYCSAQIVGYNPFEDFDPEDNPIPNQTKPTTLLPRR
jgi:hypothetical protein